MHLEHLRAPKQIRWPNWLSYAQLMLNLASDYGGCPCTNTLAIETPYLFQPWMSVLLELSFHDLEHDSLELLVIDNFHYVVITEM